MADRISCCVPFCRRTTPSIDRDGRYVLEHLCQKHWKLTSKPLRRIYRRRQRLYHLGDDAQRRHLDRIWKKLKHQAMEGALYA